MTLYDIWTSQYNADFRIGFEMLKKHNPGAVTRQILARLQTVAYSGENPSEYETGKLTSALSHTHLPESISDSEILVTTGIDATPKVGAVFTVKVPAALPPFRESTTIEAKTPTTSARAKSLHKEHGHAHAQMVLAETDADRATQATRIMEEIVPSLDKEYDRLRTGGDSENEGQHDAPLDGAAKLRELHSIRTRISAIKKLLKKPNDKAREAELEKELSDKIIRRDILTQELA